MCLQRINKEGSMGWDGFDIEAKLDRKKTTARKRGKNEIFGCHGYKGESGN